MFDFSPVQIIIVLAIALLIFGPKRLPELGRNLGRGLRDFKSGISGDEPVTPATTDLHVEDETPRRAVSATSEPGDDEVIPVDDRDPAPVRQTA